MGNVEICRGGTCWVSKDIQQRRQGFARTPKVEQATLGERARARGPDQKPQGRSEKREKKYVSSFREKKFNRVRGEVQKIGGGFGQIRCLGQINLARKYSGEIDMEREEKGDGGMRFPVVVNHQSWGKAALRGVG